MEEKELTETVETEETPESTEEHTEQVAQETAQPTKEENIRALREENQRIEKQAQEYRRQLQAYQQQQQQTPQQRRELKDDDLAEGKDINEIKRQLESMRIKSERPGIDTIVNSQMGKLIDEKYPRMSAILSSIQDPMYKEAAVYDFIKDMNLDEQQHKKEDVDQAIRKAESRSKTMGGAREVVPNPLNEAHSYENKKGIPLSEKQKLREEVDRYSR